PGAALIAHLGNYFVFFGSLGKHPGLPNIMGKGFLYIHVLAHLHGLIGGYGMVMVRGRYRNGINIVFFLFQHLPEIVIVLGFGERFSGIDRLPVIHIAESYYIYLRTFGK